MSDQLQHARLIIEAVGETPEAAIGHALRLIGLLNEYRHTKGATVGSTTGNASGRWDELPNAPHEPPPTGDSRESKTL